MAALDTTLEHALEAVLIRHGVPLRDHMERADRGDFASDLAAAVRSGKFDVVALLGEWTDAGTLSADVWHQHMDFTHPAECDDNCIPVWAAAGRLSGR